MEECTIKKAQQNGVEREENLTEMTACYKSILQNLGEDPEREGLLKTPERASKALMFFTKGYSQNVQGKCHQFISLFR